MRSANGARVSPDGGVDHGAYPHALGVARRTGGAAGKPDDGAGGDLGFGGHRLVAVVRGREPEEQQEARGEETTDGERAAEPDGAGGDQQPYREAEMVIVPPAVDSDGKSEHDENANGHGALEAAARLSW